MDLNDDKETIIKDVEKVLTIKMEILFPKLIEWNILDKNNLTVQQWKGQLDNPKIKREIYLEIRRNPDKIKKLGKFLDDNNLKLFYLLEDPRVNYAIADSQGSQYSDEDSIYNPLEAQKSLDVEVVKANEFLDKNREKKILKKDGKRKLVIGTYRMRSKPRGYVLIITLIKYNIPGNDRHSAKLDTMYLKRLFEQSGFIVITLNDLTADEIKDKIKEFTENGKLKDVDSCFIFISGHGDSDCNENKSILLDANLINIDYAEIINFFSVENCPYLAGKPKVFTIQACRGENHQKARNHDFNANGIENKIKDLDLDKLDKRVVNFGNKSIANFSDILIVHSTLPNHKSYRIDKNGTLFILIYCDIFMKHAWCNDYELLIRKVDEHLEGILINEEYFQTLTIKNIGFKKLLYINPGLFEDESQDPNDTENNSTEDDDDDTESDVDTEVEDETKVEHTEE